MPFFWKNGKAPMSKLEALPFFQKNGKARTLGLKGSPRAQILGIVGGPPTSMHVSIKLIRLIRSPFPTNSRQTAAVSFLGSSIRVVDQTVERPTRKSGGRETNSVGGEDVFIMMLVSVGEGTGFARKTSTLHLAGANQGVTAGRRCRSLKRFRKVICWFTKSIRSRDGHPKVRLQERAAVIAKTSSSKTAGTS